VFERFGDDARRAVVIAQDECRRLHHAKVRSAHLALGALAAGDPLPGAAAVPGLLLAALGEGDADSDSGDGIPFAGSARRVIGAGLKRADAAHRPVVDRFDLLLAALDEPAVADLIADDVDLDGLRQAALDARHATAPNGDAEILLLLRQIVARLDVIESRLDDRDR
jgi:hypothetical protein